MTHILIQIAASFVVLLAWLWLTTRLVELFIRVSMQRMGSRGKHIRTEETIRYDLVGGWMIGTVTSVALIVALYLIY